MKSKKMRWLLFPLFLVGAGVFLYPTISQWQSTRSAVLAVQSYEQEIGRISSEEYERMWQEAVNYNEQLRGNAINDPFSKWATKGLPPDYEKMLRVSDLMGYIEIPLIKEKLPIYHGVEEEVLQKGIGHMEGSALPVGTMEGHVLLVGHTGLPNARLFTDVDQLKVGDQFNIRVLNRELVYQVDQISVVLPDDVSKLMTQKDGDYASLITCTPYGINSHRLLVRGKHIHTLTKELKLNSYYFRWIFVGGGNRLIFTVILCVLAGLELLLLLILLRDRQKRKMSLAEAWQTRTGMSHEEKQERPGG